MQDHAARGSATLTGGADSAEEDRLRRHFEIGTGRNDQRIVAAELHDGSPEPAMNRLRDVQAHVYRPGSRDERNPLIIREFLTNAFAVAE